MKSILRDIHWLTLLAGTVGALLRFCLLLEGTDDTGLYPADHFSWTLLTIFTLAVLVFLFMTTRHAGRSPQYLANFPASLPGALGFVLGAAALIWVGLQGLSHQDLLLQIKSIVAIPAATGLLLAAWSRFRGEKVHYLVYLLPCLFFSLNLFCMGRIYGSEPEESRFLYAFFASAAVILSFYLLWGYAVDLGNRALSLFFSLSAVYLCMVAVPGREDALLYAGIGACLFLNLCPRQVALRRRIPASPAEETEPATSPIPDPQEE